MNRQLALIICVAAVVAGGIGTISVDGWYRAQEQAARSAHEQDIANAKRDNAARKLANAEELAARARKRKEKLIIALGGPMEATVKNPDYGIAQMLKALGEACAPPGSDVKVRVDRFTEFELAINLPMNTSPDIPDLCLNVLRRGLPYLSGLRVFQQGSVIADFDDRMISAKTDWSNATIADVKALLENAVLVPSQSAQSSTSTAPEDDGLENNPEGQAVKRAYDAYNALSHDYTLRLSDVIACQDRAVNLRYVRSEEDLQSKVTALQANQEALEETKQFFLHSTGEYRLLLEHEKLNPLLIKILIRKPARVEMQKVPYLRELFSALDERQRECSAMAGLMKSTYGTWSADSQQGTIRFFSTDLRDTYERLRQSLETAAERVKVAEANLVRIKNEGDSTWHPTD